MTKQQMICLVLMLLVHRDAKAKSLLVKMFIFLFYHVQALISMPFTADFEMLVQLCCFCVLFCLY